MRPGNSFVSPPVIDMAQSNSHDMKIPARVAQQVNVEVELLI